MNMLKAQSYIFLMLGTPLIRSGKCLKTKNMIKEGLLQQRKGVLGLNNVNFPTYKKTCHQIWFSIRLLEVFFTLNYLFVKNVRNKE